MNVDLGKVLLVRLPSGNINLNRLGLSVQVVVFDRYPSVLEKWYRVMNNHAYARSLEEGLSYTYGCKENLEKFYGKCVEELSIKFDLMGSSLDEAISFVMTWMNDHMEHVIRYGISLRQFKLHRNHHVLNT